METQAVYYLAKALILLPMVSVPIAEGMIIQSALNAIGRNPKLEETLFSKVIIFVALAETTAIYSLVAFFLL